MWDNYFSNIWSKNCEYLKISGSLKYYRFSCPRTVTQDSKPENCNQSSLIDMSVSKAHIYVDYFKIRQSLSMN